MDASLAQIQISGLPDRSDNPFAPGAINHLYVSERRHDAAAWGPRIYLDTINCPNCFSGLPTIRADGKEICWMGDRGDSYGDKDIYCATRRALVRLE